MYGGRVRIPESKSKSKINPPPSGALQRVGSKRGKSTPGPKPSITREVVERVSERVGRGLTLEMSLAAEACPTINKETWKKALAAHPEFSPLYEGGKGKFLDWATRRLAEDKDPRHLQWLLLRRHPDLFCEQPTAVVENHVNVGIPEDVLRRAEELAKERGKGRKLTEKLETEK